MGENQAEWSRKVSNLNEALRDLENHLLILPHSLILLDYLGLQGAESIII